MRFRQLLPFFNVLFALHIIWGPTYFITRIGVESWPSLMMATVRFPSVGILLTSFLLIHGHKLPPLRLVLNAALIGTLLLAMDNGLVTVAERQNVPSGTVAVMVATAPLLTLCFSHFFGIKTRKLERLGIAIGLAGIIMLNSEGNLSGSPWGAILIPIGLISRAFGSMHGSCITLPVGTMAGVIEMLAASIVPICVSLLSGEKPTTMPTFLGFMAVAYLTLFGSIIAINVYIFLIRNTSPALATSYAYVNPVVVVPLGTDPGGERLAPIEWLALGAIVFVMVLVTLGKYLFPAKTDTAATPSEKTLR